MRPITWFRSSVNKQISETLSEILSVVDQSQQKSGVEKVKVFVTERLAAAAEEISVVFERAIRDYQEEIERQRKLLDFVLKRDMKSHREDAHHLVVCKEDHSPRLEQEEPECPYIKEEQEETASSQRREALPGLEESDIIKFTFNPENGEEKRLSHPKQSEDTREPESLAGTSTGQMIKSDEEDWGLSGADGDFEPAGGLEPATECQPLSSDCSESEMDEDEWRETKKPRPGLRKVDSEMSQRDEEQNMSVGSSLSPSEELSNDLNSTGESASSFCCKVCRRFHPTKKSFMSHIKGHSRDCGLCGKHLELGETLKLHFEVHKTCDFCSKKCATICDLEKHLLVHTKEKPFSCAICKKEFAGKYTLKIHMRLHTGEKPYTCEVCHKSFTQTGSLKIHMRYHTGERPFSCTVCKKDFIDRTHLNTHMRQHTGEKPYSCAFCIKSYRRNSDLKTHMKIHVVGTSDGNANVPFYYGPLIRPGNVATNLMLQSSIHLQ